ncbi:FCGBP protein, partial [Prunella fulvescens]|nr:FCGBP protein [Prunella fulvescens]
ERCEMVDGQPECIQETFSTCWLAGSHYRSFDGKTFDFMGTCAYTLTTICNPDPTFPAFSVEVTKKEKENSKVSSIGSVTIHVDNITVTAVQSENGMVRIDEQLVNLPYHYSERKIVVYRHGQDAVVVTNFGLVVTYDWYSHVTTMVPRDFTNTLCGLCGN